MSPRGLGDAVRVGPISKQSNEVIEMLSDPARCQVILVTVPEETPVNELVDTAFQLEDRIGVQLGPVVVNACYPEPGVAASVDDVQRLADELGVFVSPREATDLVAAAEFRRERYTLQQQQADRLAGRLPLPQVRLPFLFTAELGPPEIDILAATFAAQIEALPESSWGRVTVP
jgi:anion-transporting  ArsA/GET3 family ATPase